jgi:monoamine oxidase
MAARIIVIGAGAAGLLTSHLLLQKGYEVTILEARDRTGGRIHTLQKQFTMPLEAGAEFVHGRLPLTAKLIKEARLKERKVKGRFYQFSGVEYRDAEFLNDEIEEVSKIMKKVTDDMTFTQFIKQYLTSSKHEKVITQLLKLVEGYDGADPEKISTFALRDEWSEWNEEDDIRIEGNYDGVITYLNKSVTGSEGKIRLSSEVQRIDWTKGRVTVAAGGKTFTGDKVIVTVPVSIIQQNKITFSPDIPHYTHAARNIGFGAVVKFLFEFKDDISKVATYRKIRDFRFIFTDLTIPTWWSQLPESSRVFTGWLGGPKAFSLPKEPAQQYKIALQCLSSMLELKYEETESLLMEWHIADWVNDPFCLGAYAYAMPGSVEARSLLNKPIEETIFFAGEAISEGESMGTVEAAFESAEQVVKRVMNSRQESNP